MKYFIVLAIVVAAVAGAPIEEESKPKDKRGIFAAPLLHSAPIALPAYHPAPLISAPLAHAPLALPAPILSHPAPLALPAFHSAPLISAHAPLALPYSFGHGIAYGGLLH